MTPTDDVNRRAVRRRGPAAAGVTFLVVTAVLVGVGAFFALRLGSAEEAPRSSAAPHDYDTMTWKRYEGDLRTLLLPVPPSATKTSAPGASSNGTIDIDQAAATYADPAAGRTLLMTGGFRRGATIEWLEDDVTWVGVIAYQFYDPSDQRRWAEGLQRKFRSDSVFGPGVEIAGVPEGVVFQRTTIANGRWLSEAVFGKNDITVEVFISGALKRGPEKAVEYAKAQYALLP
jgi:hypothetical protein